MIDLKGQEVWFVTGSQHLYGESVLQKVAANAEHIVRELGGSSHISARIVFKDVQKDADEILRTCREANRKSECIGVVAWMHTFSPARMWIGGLKELNKPLLHLHTQFNRDIPWETIDMDFMNLNQSAHGDREFGHIMSRMRLNRKVVVGHWKDENVHARLNAWIRAASAWHDWQGARFCRFGDNMRDVAVTEGDKVEAEIRLGFRVNGFGIGDLVSVVNQVSDDEISTLVQEYESRYVVSPALRKGGNRYDSLREAARIELGLRAFLKAGNFKGFTTTFEDLHGLRQLPGIAVQRLMNEGYGFGAEGDWKTAALVRAMKVMGAGLEGGTSFMEDYTYHLDADPMILGAHMLEICESIAAEKPSCEIHSLGIGGKDDPVRLVFNSAAGNAVNASLIDMGNRFRLLVNTVEAVAPRQDLPKLPVARALWKPDPDFNTACTAWILAGGAHHTGYSQCLTVEHLEDFAEMAKLEFLLINKETRITSFKDTLRLHDRLYC